MIGLPKPEAGAPDEPWPAALALHGFAGASDPCAPSESSLIGPMQIALLAANGFVTIAPDFIGMNGRGGASTAPHAPLLGEQVAIGAWDAMRAGRSLLAGELGLRLQGEPRDDLVIWGASQGGHAAFSVGARGEPDDVPLRLDAGAGAGQGGAAVQLDVQARRGAGALPDPG